MFKEQIMLCGSNFKVVSPAAGPPEGQLILANNPRKVGLLRLHISYFPFRLFWSLLQTYAARRYNLVLRTLTFAAPQSIVDEGQAGKSI